MKNAPPLMTQPADREYYLRWLMRDEGILSPGAVERARRWLENMPTENPLVVGWPCFGEFLLGGEDCLTCEIFDHPEPHFRTAEQNIHNLRIVLEAIVDYGMRR